MKFTYLISATVTNNFRFSLGVIHIYLINDSSINVGKKGKRQSCKAKPKPKLDCNSINGVFAHNFEQIAMHSTHQKLQKSHRQNRNLTLLTSCSSTRGSLEDTVSDSGSQPPRLSICCKPILVFNCSVCTSSQWLRSPCIRM